MLTWQYVHGLVPSKWKLRIKTFFSCLPFVKAPHPYLMTFRSFINQHCKKKKDFAAPLSDSQEQELFTLLQRCPASLPLARCLVDKMHPKDRTISSELKQQQTKMEIDEKVSTYPFVQRTLSKIRITQVAPVTDSAPSIELPTLSTSKSPQEYIPFLRKALNKTKDESEQATLLNRFFAQLPRAEHVNLINKLLTACEQGETTFLPVCINILRGKISSYVNDHVQFKPAKEHFYLANFLADEKYTPPTRTEKDRDDLRSIIENINKTGFKIPPALHEKILLSLILLAEKLATEDVRATLDKTPTIEIDRICKNWFTFINTYTSLTPGEKPSEILQNLIEQIKKHAAPDHSRRALQWMNPLQQLHHFKDHDRGQIALKELKKEQEFQAAVDAIDPIGARRKRARAM